MRKSQKRERERQHGENNIVNSVMLTTDTETTKLAKFVCNNNRKKREI